MSWDREQRERRLEELLERYTAGQEPLQRALTIIKIFRDSSKGDEEWVIECHPDCYRVTRRPPLL
jgi:hypothetical protein